MEINFNKKTDDTLEVPHKGVHTLNQDISHEATVGSPGTIKAIIDSAEDKEEEKEKNTIHYSVNQLYMIFGFIALILAGGLIYYFTFFLAKDSGPVGLPQQSLRSMFLVDKSGTLELGGLTKIQILKTLSDESEKVVLPAGKIQTFYLTENKQNISLQRFLQILEANVALPAANIFSPEFMFGVFSSEGNHPFVLIRVKSMNDAFPTMHSWEKKMLYDLGTIFGYELTPDTQYLLTKNFEDGIMQNKNARILRDEFGSTVLGYVYLDDNSILITDFDGVVGEIIERQTQSSVRK